MEYEHDHQRVSMETLTRPEGLTDEHLDHLDYLRASGTVNMNLAASHLVNAFNGLNKEKASAYLAYWKQTFGNKNR